MGQIITYENDGVLRVAVYRGSESSVVEIGRPALQNLCILSS